VKALARLPAPQGIAAMQFISVVVINRVFSECFSAQLRAARFSRSPRCSHGMSRRRSGG
jgi:hypothetical protein